MNLGRPEVMCAGRGRTRAPLLRVLDQQDLQAKRNMVPFNIVAASLNPFLELSQVVGNPRPGWGGRSPVDRAALALAPERTGMTATALLLPGPGSEGKCQEAQSRAQIHGLT